MSPYNANRVQDDYETMNVNAHMPIQLFVIHFMLNVTKSSIEFESEDHGSETVVE